MPIRPLSVVKHKGAPKIIPSENHARRGAPLIGNTFVFLGEITNLPGMGIFIGVLTGYVYYMKPKDFEELSQDEF